MIKCSKYQNDPSIPERKLFNYNNCRFGKIGHEPAKNTVWIEQGNHINTPDHM